ncbi:hypothetical protein ACS0TY_007897 [Phlomoides rotata]
MAIRKWLVGLICVMITTKHAYVSTSAASAMYVLGDSSVDCGDNTPLDAFIPKNISQFPCNGSDATLLPHLIAKKMGLPYTTPFYSQNGSIPEIQQGINFGSAEATILYPGSSNYQSLNQQLRQAFETLQLLQLQLGQETATNFIRSSVFYLSFGKDDFLDYFLRNSSETGFKYNGQNFTQILVHQMMNAIRSLYASNVRKIVCAGVLPLGCTPHLMSSSSSKGCFDEANTLVLEFNTRLQQNIAAINAELRDAHIIFCDVYRAIMEFINNPKAYGIEDVKNACCGLGRGGGCFSTNMACGKASTHIWWDFNNPTPAVNSLLADSTWSGRPVSSICSPITLQQLLA